MIKLNNKGFAITTLVYGIAIMGILLVGILMSTLAATRSNSNALVKSIEEELNRLNKTSVSFKYIGDDPQEFVVPDNNSGLYRIELWGGGKGDYTTGIIELVEDQKLYFYIGNEENKSNTEVRLVGEDYDSEISKNSRIMVAVGENKTEEETSYISGYAGCGVSKSTDSEKTIYFKNGIILPGVNEENGYAKIEKISRDLSNNSKNIKTISLSLETTNPNQSYIVKTQNNGEEKEYTGQFVDGNATITINKIVDEIGIWFPNYNGELKAKANESLIKITDANDKTMNYENNNNIYGEYNNTGIHISPYELIFNETLENGIYYIQISDSENKFLTFQDDKYRKNNIIGTPNQKWSIEKGSDGKYKINELSKYTQLILNKQEEWLISPQVDGTYLISNDNNKNLIINNNGLDLGDIATKFKFIPLY